MRGLKYERSTKPHALTDVVRKAFAPENGHATCHDAVTLSVFLMGATHLSGKSMKMGNGKTCTPTGAMKAYYIVAHEALSFMEDQGLLRRDQWGWWLATPALEVQEAS